MKYIALFGGSFDPPHLGHVAVVEALLQREDIEKIIVMPTYLNPFKFESVAPSSLRLKWLRDIFSSYENVVISDYEVNQNKKVPSIQSVDYLLQNNKNLYLVIGADNLKSFDKWYKYEELITKVKVIIASRNSIAVNDTFTLLHVSEDVSSTALRKDMDMSKLPQKCAEEIFHYYKEQNAKKS